MGAMGERAFNGRTVLVTGAGGSIGSYLCKIIASHDARELRLVSLTEGALYNVERELRREYGKYRSTKITPILGSVCDEVLMSQVLRGVDVVIHAAAHKHVPICEANPHAAIANNVGGTWSLMKAAAMARVGQFCLISSDKAVKPASIMGATKRVAELLVRDVPVKYGWVHTRFYTVRFGNVVDSAGSVMPLWREQIEAGGPITLTDERCERYFMTIPQACGLICEVIAMDPSENGTFVLDMGKPVRLIDLALQLISRANRKITIDIIGLRPGEKLTEELNYGGVLESTADPKIFRVREPSPDVRLKLAAVDELLEDARQRREGVTTKLWALVA